MSRLPALKPDEVVRKRQSAGFEIDHVTGSHYIMRHPDRRRTVVPYHAGRDIKGNHSASGIDDERIPYVMN